MSTPNDSGPPTSVPPNGASALRIGDTERIAAATALGDHFAAGRLDQTELDDRLGRAYAAKTYADLRPLFTDLPDPDPTRSRTAPPPPAAEPAPGARPSIAPPWVQTAWVRRRPSSPAGRIVGAVLAVLVVMAVLSALAFVVLPVMVILAVLFWLTGGPIRRHHRWQRRSPVAGRAPWGGDNAAWYQFGWSGRDWSHLANRGPRGKGLNPHGPDYYAHRHHPRRRRG